MKNNILSALGLFTVLTVSANAASVTWTGGTNTAWANGNNWGGTAPVNDLTTDVANFNSGTYANQPNAGTTSISGITVGSSSGTLTLAGTQLSIGGNGISVASGAGSTTVSSPIVLGAAQTWTNASSSTLSTGAIANGGFTLTSAGAGNITLAGIYSGAGGLTQSGTGTLKLSGANSYTGATLISSGTVQVGSSTSFGATSGITLSTGATLDLNGQSSGKTLTSWAGDVTNNSVTAATYSGQVNAVSGTIDGTGNINLAGTITNGTLTKNGANSVTLSGTGSDSSLAVIVNAGTLLLDNTASAGDGAIRGNLTINGGLVQYLASNQIHNGVGNVVVNSGSLDMNSFSDTINTLQIGNTTGTTSGSVTNTGGGGLLTISTGPIAATNGTATANLGGSVGLTKTTSGTVTLSGTNTFTGATAINAGTLALGSTSALGATTGVTVAVGATLDLGGQNYATALATTLNGDLTNSSIAATYTGAISLGTAATVDGAGNITLSGAVTNNVLNKNGTNTVTLSGAGNNTSLAVVVNSGTVILNKTASDGAIRGKDGNGNALTINGGTVQLGANDQIRNSTADVSTGIVYVKGGTFDINSKTDTINGLEIGATDGTASGTVSSTGGAGALTISGSSGQAGGNAIAVTNGSASASLAGAVVLTKSTSATFTLSGANTYSGGTTISAGKLYVNNTSGSGTGTGAVTIVSGATLAGSGTIKPTGGAAVAIVSGATLASGSNQTANAVVNGGTGAVNGTGTGGGLTLDNTEASSSLLTIAGGAQLTFALGSTTPLTGGTGFLNFANPNTDSTYLSLTGSTVDQIFSNTTVADTINLIDLTTGSTSVSLTLRSQNPYLLIQSGLTTNSDFANLVTSGGTGVNGYVLGVSNGTGGYTAFNLGAYDITGNQLNSPTNLENLRLYLYNGNLEVVPEPGTWALMLGGLVLLVIVQRRKNKAL